MEENALEWELSCFRNSSCLTACVRPSIKTHGTTVTPTWCYPCVVLLKSEELLLRDMVPVRTGIIWILRCVPPCLLTWLLSSLRARTMSAPTQPILLIAPGRVMHTDQVEITVWHSLYTALPYNPYSKLTGSPEIQDCQTRGGRTIKRRHHKIQKWLKNY